MVVRLLWCSVLLASCSFILPFSADGQPCDDGGACLDDFVCRGGMCVRPSDAGTPSDGGGGTGGACGCSADQQCVGGSCFDKSCGPVPCATGAVCENGRCVSLACVGQVCDGGICAAGACEPASCVGGPCPPGQACRSGSCVDVSCVGLSCAAPARCLLGGCITCPIGAAEFGQDCANGLDDDCDGKVDCADTGCLGTTCNDNSRCTTTDRCVADGGCRGTPVVCADAGVAGACQGNFCDPATGQCAHRVLANGQGCGTTGSMRCCDGGCVDTGTDRANCGGCGIACGLADCVSTTAVCGLGAAQPSGRCQCMGTTVPCVAQGMRCENVASVGASYCAPMTLAACAPGQRIVTPPSCPATCAY